MPQEPHIPLNAQIATSSSQGNYTPLRPGSGIPAPASVGISKAPAAHTKADLTFPARFYIGDPNIAVQEQSYGDAGPGTFGLLRINETAPFSRFEGQVDL